MVMRVALEVSGAAPRGYYDGAVAHRMRNDLISRKGRIKRYLSRRESSEDVSQRLPPMDWTSP